MPRLTLNREYRSIQKIVSEIKLLLANITAHKSNTGNPHNATHAQLPDVSALDTNPHGNLRFKVDYEPYSSYNRNDVVNDNGWLMHANKVTLERAAPQPIGDAEYFYTGTLLAENVTAKQVIFGNRYIAQQAGWISGYRVDVVAGNNYQVYYVVDPLGNADIYSLVSFTATTTGWQEVGVGGNMLLSGSVFDLIVLAHEPDPSPVIWSADWNYMVAQNPSTPGNGEIRHSRSQTDLMNISSTDATAVDRSASLAVLTAGDIIDAAGVRWAIQLSTDNGTYFAFTVSPAVNGSPTGIQTFNVETVTPTPISYGREAGAWTGVPVEGLFIADGDYADIVVSDDAYGVDVRIQSAQISTDWDILTGPYW